MTTDDVSVIAMMIMAKYHQPSIGKSKRRPTWGGVRVSREAASSQGRLLQSECPFGSIPNASTIPRTGDRVLARLISPSRES